MGVGRNGQAEYRKIIVKKNAFSLGRPLSDLNVFFHYKHYKKREFLTQYYSFALSFRKYVRKNIV